MSYQALARKWRPQTFAEVIGQEHVVSALANALESGRVHHAYLFTGTRGIGKTTLARILAKALNCETGITATPCGECAACSGIGQGSYVDLIEVDAASRTKVEDTREMLENVQYAPTLGRSKIYLIDEVHMLSGHSFNALLKTLEEPPAHVKFLLATTDPQKLPPTILSRCIQFNLKAMELQQLQDHLGHLLEEEGIPFDAEALRVLARSADGSVRDALSLLDQAIAHGRDEVRTQRVRAMLGMIDEQFTLDLLRAAVARDGAAVLATVAGMAGRAVDFRAALDDVLATLHNAALYQISPEALTWKGVDPGPAAEVAGLAGPELVQLFYQVALVGKRDLALAPDPRAGFEMALLRMALFQPEGGAPGDAGSAGTIPDSGGTRNDRGQDNRAGQPGAVLQGNGYNGGGRAGPAGGAQDAGPARAVRRPADDRPDTSGAGVPSPGRAAVDNPAVGIGRSDAEAGTATTPAPPISGENGIGTDDGWAAFAAGCNLGGITQELVMNMSPVGIEGDTLELVLKNSSRNLLRDERVERIRKRCSEYLGREMRLDVQVGSVEEIPGESPAARKEREVRERQARAEKTFLDDPNVRELMDRFDAELVPDSVRPPVE